MLWLSIATKCNVQLTTVRDNRIKMKDGVVDGMAALSQLYLESGNLFLLWLAYDAVVQKCEKTLLHGWAGIT